MIPSIEAGENAYPPVASGNSVLVEIDPLCSSSDWKVRWQNCALRIKTRDLQHIRISVSDGRTMWIKFIEWSIDLIIHNGYYNLRLFSIYFEGS